MTSTLQQEAGPQAAVLLAAGHAGRPAPLRGRLDHLHADRLDHPVVPRRSTAARTQAAALYGPDYVPAQPRRYERKVKNAQEAHEAIRPAGETFRTPDEAARALSGDELRLYELIWKRTVASQMADATGTSAQVRLVGDRRRRRGRARGRVLGVGQGHRVPRLPPGLRRGRGRSRGRARRPRGPPAAGGRGRPALGVRPRAGRRTPPSRRPATPRRRWSRPWRTSGVGRPSTYASVIATILDRGYVWKKGTALVPSFTAFAVVGLLERYFAALVDYGFTASMEDDLDAIAAGDEQALPWLTRFYFGDGDAPRRTGGNWPRQRRRRPVTVTATGATARDGPPAGTGSATSASSARSAPTSGEIDAREINSIPIGAGADGAGDRGPGRPLRAVPPARRGPGVDPRGPGARRADRRAGRGAAEPPRRPTGCSGPTPRPGSPSRSGPAASVPTSSSARWTRAAPSPGPPRCSPPCRRPPSPWTRRSTCCASPGWWAPTRTRARRSWPTTAGSAPTSSGGRHAQPAHRGPAPHRRPRRGAGPVRPAEDPRVATPEGPLREIGADPDTGLPMVVKDGRFGPYVTDGTTNASLRRGDDVESLTVERAAELLAERRAAGTVGPQAGPPNGREEGRRRTKKARGQEGRGQEGGGSQEGSGDQEERPARRRPPARRRRRRSRSRPAADGAPRRPCARDPVSDRPRRSADRRRGHRRLRQDHPGPHPRLPARGAAHFRARRHCPRGRAASLWCSIAEHWPSTTARRPC